MKTIVIGISLSLASWCVVAQAPAKQGSKQTENAVKPGEGTAPVQHPMPDSARAEQPNATNNKTVVSTNEDQQAGQQNTQAQRSNAPAVMQSTSSESGSPAVLSENNGRGRDGTNNVQRAKPNIAGAEVPGNMNMSERNTEGKQPAGTKRVRKENEQPAQITRDGTENTDPEGSVKPNEEKKEKQTKKSKRKARRNRDRDSGR